MPNSPARHDSLKAIFQAQFEGYCDEQSITFCTVEMLDVCIRQVKRGKAAGHDQLTVEHLVYAHPIGPFHADVSVRAYTGALKMREWKMQEL